MSSSVSRRIAPVSSLGCLTAIPSAIVKPCSVEPVYGAHAAAWTPTTRTFGCSSRSASAIPDARPPPPIGTTSVSSSGSCSAISSPIVPWPAITRSSSKACTKVAPVVLGALERRGERLVEVLAGQLDVRPVVHGRLDLRHRRVLRHEDRRRDLRLARRPRDRLAVVAGARRDHARGALGVAQRRDLVDGAADLERARALERLGLQLDVAADHARERLRGEDRASRARCPSMRSRASRISLSVGTVSVANLEHLLHDLAHGRERVELARLDRRPAAAAARDRPRPRARDASSHAPTRPRTPRRPGSSAAARRAARRPRGGRDAPRSSPRARARRSPRVASVSTIGGFQARSLSSERIERTSFSIVFAAGMVGLVDRDHVRDLHDPRLQRLDRVAGAGHQHEHDRVGDADHLRPRSGPCRPSPGRSAPSRPRPAAAPPAASPRRARPGGRACPSSG